MSFAYPRTELLVLRHWGLTGHAAGGATITQWLRARDIPT